MRAVNLIPFPYFNQMAERRLKNLHCNFPIPSVTACIIYAFIKTSIWSYRLEEAFESWSQRRYHGPVSNPDLVFFNEVRMSLCSIAWNNWVFGQCTLTRQGRSILGTGPGIFTVGLDISRVIKGHKSVWDRIFVLAMLQTVSRKAFGRGEPLIHGHWVTTRPAASMSEDHSTRKPHKSCHARPCAQMLHDAYCSYSGNLAKMERGTARWNGQRGETIATLQFSAFFSDVSQRKALQTIETPSCRWLTPRRSRRSTIFQISRFIQVWHSMKSGETITNLKSIKMHQSEVYRTAGSLMWQCSIHSKTCPGPGPRWGRNLLVGPSCELRWFQTCGVIWGDFSTELHPSKFFSWLAYACPILEDTPCPQTRNI